VYVAWKSGINVYKADGSLWGTAPSIPITMGGKTVGVGFGGADRKTLYVTTDGGKVFKGTVKVPGLL